MSPPAGARRLVFVTPRYGPDVVGGSEAVMREAAHGLARRGHAVEIVTTCARDHYTWANAYPAGVTEHDGVTVRRFPVERDADGGHAALEAAVQSGAALDPADQVRWVNGLFRSPSLHRHLAVHARDHDAVVFSPYLFWTTLAGADLAPERTIVMPCLHDEAYARLPVVASVLQRSALHWYLSDPERDLAHRLGLAGRAGAVVGAGIEIPSGHHPERVHPATDGRPFLLYAGRREAGKGWDVLVDAWADAVGRGAEIDLVSMGVGECRPPAGLDDRLHDLGFVPDDEAPDWFAAAAAYVQPSRMESFSRTVMEAWLAGTAVLANRDSDVVVWHCRRSGAGVTWRGRAELAAAIELVAARPHEFDALARPGRAYVEANYRWDVVLDAMEQSLEELPCAG